MAVGCHRIPFWPEQTLRKLNESLIFFLVFSPEDHDSLSSLVERFSTLLILHVCPIWYEYYLPLDPSKISYAIIEKILRKTSRCLPIKCLSISGAEVVCILEYLLPTQTASLYNRIRLFFCSNASLASRISESMATTSSDFVPSCGSAFHEGSNNGGLVGINCDCCFDPIIFICGEISSVVKALPLLD